MKIYTKTGDDGETGLFGGPRVPKHAPRIEAYGNVDELNAVIGLARSEMLPDEVDMLLESIQHDLFAVGAELATPDPAKHGTRIISEPHSTRLEQAIDHFEGTLPPLQNFILPGGSRGASLLHFARTVCRRAERGLVFLRSASSESISGDLVIYLNRLSDLLFVLARAVNRSEGCDDVAWHKDG